MIAFQPALRSLGRIQAGNEYELIGDNWTSRPKIDD